MKLGKTLYAKNRVEWRKWLEKHYEKEKEIWLIYYRKATGKPRVEYSEAVEEALCFGWIDSTQKRIDDERFAQRFSPRKPKSQWSQMNIERMRRLVEEGKITPAGLAVFKGNLEEILQIPSDILRTLKKDKIVWQNFQKFPESYKRIRIGWIEGARKRPQEFQKRLKYFLEKTAMNKLFGMVQ